MTEYGQIVTRCLSPLLTVFVKARFIYMTFSTAGIVFMQVGFDNRQKDVLRLILSSTDWVEGVESESIIYSNHHDCVLTSDCGRECFQCWNLCWKTKTGGQGQRVKESSEVMATSQDYIALLLDTTTWRSIIIVLTSENHRLRQRMNYSNRQRVHFER